MYVSTYLCIYVGCMYCAYILSCLWLKTQFPKKFLVVNFSMWKRTEKNKIAKYACIFKPIFRILYSTLGVLFLSYSLPSYFLFTDRICICIRGIDKIKTAGNNRAVLWMKSWILTNIWGFRCQVQKSILQNNFSKVAHLN